jgi:Zn-dependent protease with chaperone function
MNFFERQERARRKSRLIVVLFVVAMVCIVLAMDLATTIIWYFTRLYVDRPLQGPPRWLHIVVMGATVTVILVASIRKSIEMQAGGGIAVARMMDARQIVPVNATLLERRLLNVVQEMAIAAGTRLPVVYVMDDHGGINSFAAGAEGSLSVIVVTRGALHTLNRDELQAVVGHEFSHIVNGDMALNLRMIGVLAGLLFIGAAGEHVLRVAAESARQDIRATPFTFFVGGALFSVGYIGLFFGRVIKAMVAREREYLADAGSVQFTRNPEGLAGALDQVRRLHSTVLHPRAEDVSHLFFSEAIYLEEERVLATHPPLQERIRRLVPRFRDNEYRSRRPDPAVELEKSAAAQGVGRRSDDVAHDWSLTPGEALGLVGTVGARDVRAATALLHALPQAARTALETRDGARGLVLALILATDDAMRGDELAALKAHGFGDLAAVAAHLSQVGRALPLAWHLPVVDLAFPELRAQSDAARHELIEALEVVVRADRRVPVYRFAYLSFVRSQLEPTARVGNRTLDSLREEVALILSLVAHAGCAHAATATADFAKAFEAGVKEMGLDGRLRRVEREQCDAQSAARAMERLRELGPLPKAHLVKGLFAAVTADGTIRVVEAALMRMIGAVLDCPLPSLLDELEPETLAA